MNVPNEDPKTGFEHIQCDSNDRNNGNIIIEISPDLPGKILKDHNEHSNSDAADCSDLERLQECKSLRGEEDSEEGRTVIPLCEALYESECSSELRDDSQSGNTDGQYLALVQPQSSADLNIIDDIPNDVLVYTCQPESSDSLDIFPCKSCGAEVGCIFCLKSHYESVHLNLGLIQYKCNQTSYLKNYTEICHKCNLVCESKQEMFEHRKIHFVSCDVCDMSFDSALFLSNHCKSMHERFEVIISCDLCEQWFKQLQDLSDHYDTFHEMILCIVCFRRFSTRPELVKHHGTHKIILNNVQTILPYACSKCNQAFAEISELSAHLVRDHRNKPNFNQIKTVGVKAKHRRKLMDVYDCGGLTQNDNESNENTAKKKVKK
ncbi:hypothetical protein ABEB36_001703 [Hypothenemus hampei]|uniref:C2H2-type domain-containing protein n=1 Tax=Hypothenemus hampei TaxID=57062 RepID=A0ABD1FFG5_HYPHA